MAMLVESPDANEHTEYVRMLAISARFTGFRLPCLNLIAPGRMRSRLLDLGRWWLTHQRERALWWYNCVFMPLGLRLQKKLEFHSGMIGTDDVDEILMVCRKG